MSLPRSLATLLPIVMLACGRPSHAAEQSAPAPTQSPVMRTPSLDRSTKDPRTPAPAGWTTAYRPGGVDAAGHHMGGTELRFLVPYEGKLYAGLGYWEDTAAADPATPGAQVLVKDSAEAPWRVDLELDALVRGGPTMGQRRYFATGGLDAVTLTTDGQGRKLAQSARLLVTSPWSHGPGIEVFVRGPQGNWKQTELAREKGSARSFGEHVDRTTRVSRVFAGTEPRGIFSGTYDPKTGTVAWDKANEPWSQNDAPSGDWRVMAFEECNGKLYVTAGASLYERQDGAAPAWKRVYTAKFPADTNLKASGWLRGMTAIKNPKGPGQVLLIAVESTAARMVRVDPGNAFSETVDEDVVGLLSRAWHAPVRRALLAYNDMTKVSDPRTGEQVLLIGLQAQVDPSAPFPTWEGHHSGATYLVRRPGGTYEVHSMEDSALAAPKDRVAVRTMALSPFAPDTLYAGGFDANKRPVHDTAWALQGSLATAVAP